MSEPFVTVLREIESEPGSFSPYVMASWAGKAATELERLSAEVRRYRAALEEIQGSQGYSDLYLCGLAEEALSADSRQEHSPYCSKGSGDPEDCHICSRTLDTVGRCDIHGLPADKGQTE